MLHSPKQRSYQEVPILYSTSAFGSFQDRAMTLKALRSHRDFEPEAQMLQSLSYGLRMMSLRAHSTGTILVPGNRAVLVYRISWATEPEFAGLWECPLR